MRLRARIEMELQILVGHAAGQVRLAADPAIAGQADFCIVILTPDMVASAEGLAGIAAFIAHETAAGHSDRLFPILYMNVPGINEGDAWVSNPVLATLARRQFFDWRGFRHIDIQAYEALQSIEPLCRKIAERTVGAAAVAAEPGREPPRRAASAPAG